MKAVIMAAGYGTRFGHITKTIPKALVTVAGKELLQHVFDALPEAITEYIVVIRYLGHKIIDRFGNTYQDRPITYVEQTDIGTGAALLSTEKVLRKDTRFMIVGSDDIFGSGELDKLLQYPASYGMYYGISNKGSDQKILFDQNNILHGLSITGKADEPRHFGIGAYVLPTQIFQEKFIRMANGELSIPHTLPYVSFPIHVVPIQYWLPVNSMEEKRKAEEKLSAVV